MPTQAVTDPAHTHLAGVLTDAEKTLVADTTRIVLARVRAGLLAEAARYAADNTFDYCAIAAAAITDAADLVTPAQDEPADLVAPEQEEATDG
jgi:hypothetical protein